MRVSACLYCASRPRIRMTKGESKSGRAPPVGCSLGAYRRDWLRPGTPTAPAGHRLPLLPSSPGGVHGPAPRGTRPSAPFPGKLALAPCRGEEFHPAVAGCGFRAPPAPRVARPLQTWYAHPQTLSIRARRVGVYGLRLPEPDATNRSTSRVVNSNGAPDPGTGLRSMSLKALR